MVMPSTLADRFELEREVAVGGMGRVYRGFDRQNGAPVAIKIVDHGDARARARFMREATVLAELNHPGIVRYVAHGQTDDGGAYLAMEWLEGIELSLFLSQRMRARRALAGTPDDLPDERDVATVERSPARSDQPAGNGDRDDGARKLAGSSPPTAVWQAPSTPPAAGAPVAPLSLAESVYLGRRLAFPLSAMHRRGIVHRDVKPSNVLLVDGKIGRLKLLDLGAVWRFDEHGRLTRTGHFLGTPMYMAPEQVQNEGEISAATDVWAMGVLLYQCITGVAPFTGDGLGALLASIVLAAPRPVNELCAGLPPELTELLMHMIAKKPADRPASAVEVSERLDAIAEDLAETGAARPAAVGLASTLPVDASASEQPASLTTLESRLTCMLFAVPGTPPPAHVGFGEISLQPSDGFAEFGPVRAQVIAQIAERSGGHSHLLLDGTAVLTINGQHSPIEQAALAARMAIALNVEVRDALLVLVTGRREGKRPVQMIANEAMAISRQTRSGTIRLDEMTASLLETRFHLVRDGDALYLGEERVFPAARMILGKPSKWLGRRRALATLTATFEECVDNESARAVLVTGPSGMGKSRLCREFLSAIDRLDLGQQLLYGCGDMARVGTPFNILAPAMRRYLGLLTGEPHDTAQTKIRARVAVSMAAARVDFAAAFLGEMLGVPFARESHPALESAQTDHGFRAESMRRAWLEFLQAECTRAPMLLVVEDLHFGDQPSVEYLDSALATLRDAPFMLLALARPEVESRFPRVWHKRDLTELRLHPLSAKESARLVHNALGRDCPADTVASIVERAAGNPFILEELIRVVADGSRSVPATVLAIGQDRLTALDPEAKRVLRAASVFGEAFWSDGVQALVRASDPAESKNWLNVLEQSDFIVRQTNSRFPGHSEYRFEHALIRDATYALLTDEDRRVGHAVAGAWLERAGERDPLVLAEHFHAGEQPKRAMPHFCQAAEDALAANDLQTALACADKAQSAGADGLDLGRVALVQSSAAGWLADYHLSRDRGIVASQLVAAGSPAWFTALGNAVAASYRLGEPTTGQELTRRATAMACEAGAEAHQIICLCRAGFQEFFDGRLQHGQHILDQISVVSDTGARLDIRTTGQIHSILSLRGRLFGDWTAAFQHSQAAINVFERAGDIRNYLTERVAFAHLLNAVGRHEQSVAEARAVFQASGQHGLQQLQRQAKIVLGIALMELGPAAEAEAILTEVIDEFRALGNRRMTGTGLLNLAELLLHQGRAHEAEALSAEAVEQVQGSLVFLTWALSVHALCLQVSGRTAEALTSAERAHAICERESGHTYRASLVYYAFAHALLADGRLPEALAQCTNGVAYLRASAAHFPDPDHRAAFLSSSYNRRLLSWSSELGVPDSDPTSWAD